MSIELHEALLDACVEGGRQDIAQFIAANDLDPRGHEDLQKPLMVAAHHGNIEVVELLLELGVDVNQKDIQGGCAIWSAVWMNNLPLVQLLLDHGADVEEIYGLYDEENSCMETRAAIVGLLQARLPAGTAEPVLIPAGGAGGF